MLKSEILINKTVTTAFGEVTFDHNGETTDLTVEQQEHLGTKVPYIQYIPDAPKAKEKADEAPKKAKKAPAKKTTKSKKEED
ncbi:hypothetical protein [Enterococcus phage ECP3]|uniref:DUF7349 domain-containing protein n=1 Tax=Enterococcus phage ECP3 TaxID=1498168 RepID=A0A096XT23_9CAUD|nr:hypothetical protein [Enterococcus phage ECP3]AII28457.1 hypothetical protein [Enterococcus phage ECP3]